MNERKAQINCTYIYYVPIYTNTYFFYIRYSTRLFCGFYSVHTQTHRDIFISGGFYSSKKSRQPNKKSCSFFFSMHKSTVISICGVVIFLPLSLSFHSDCWLNSQIIHTLGECAEYHMRVWALLYLFSHTKRIIINRSLKSIKLAMSWWPHNISHSVCQNLLCT